MNNKLNKLYNSIGDNELNNQKRLWIAVDGMGGDHAPGPILEGCLKAINRLPLCIKFVGEKEKVLNSAKELEIQDLLDRSIADGYLEIVSSGPSVGMDEEATVVRRKKDASINVAMNLVKKGEALAMYSAGNSGALMASAIFVWVTFAHFVFSVR